MPKKPVKTSVSASDSNSLPASVKVTFSFPADGSIENIALCGDFNDWNKSSHPMKKQKDGSFKITLTLQTGRQYEYRYYLGDEHWENDPQAGTYRPNEFGSHNSVINLETAPQE